MIEDLETDENDRPCVECIIEECGELKDFSSDDELEEGEEGEEETNNES